MPLESLRGRLETNGPLAIGSRGIEVDLDGFRYLSLPFAADLLELEVEASGPVVLTWAASSGRPFGPPWRYVRMPRPSGTLRLDLRQAAGWTPSARPILVLDGIGHVAIRAIRARPPPADPGAARAALDRALLVAPESVGPTTINTLTPSWWSATRGIWLADVVAGVALAVLVAVLAIERFRARRWRPGLALATAALVALAAWDAHFLVRFLPMADLSVPGDREARIRDGYRYAPAVGALAALARATLRPDERVLVMGREKDWSGPQTLCFNLAPRRCAISSGPPAQEYAGISGVGRLRAGDIDAIVSYRGGPLPEGFVPVAGLSPTAFVARRR